MEREEHFERSRRVVRAHVHEGTLELHSPLGNLAMSSVEEIACFRSQIHDGDFLVMERRAAQTYRILEIIQSGSILHEVYEIAEKYQLEFGFDESVEREVEARIRAGIAFEDCEDFREIPFVTVDGAGTRDLDQALYVGCPGDGFDDMSQPREGAKYIVWYAIADASWFVRPGSALFEEALNRGTSIYFADMSVPMLPGALSRGMVSLNAGVERRALVFVMQIDARGVCLHTRLCRGRLVSRAKLVSEHVSAYLADPEHHPFYRTPYAQSLLNFRDVGILRLQESRTRNVVHFTRVTLDVGLTSDRTAFRLGFDDRIDVDMYNEQLSLLCNMEGASFLSRLAREDPDVLAIFRSHEAPSPRDVDELHASMWALARAQSMPEVWYWDRERQSLSDYFDALPEASRAPDPDDSEQMRAFRVRQAMERLVLMMQRRSVFSPDAGLHSALGVNPYARFSAPMREIVGVFTHKEVVDAEFEGGAQMDRAARAALRQRVIEASNRARAVQREVDKAVDSCAISHVVSHDFDVEASRRPRRRGTILGMKASALYVRLDAPPIELKVYIRDIVEQSGQAWNLSEDMTRMSSADGEKTYIVGDSIWLRVLLYEPVKKKWRVIPVEPPNAQEGV